MKAPAIGLAAVAVLALAGCNTSNNYFQDERDPNAASSHPTTLFGSLLMASGMLDKPSHKMDTTPRPPIAIPATNDLPPPQSGDAVKATGVAWPTDPDLTRARQQQAADKAGDKATAYERDPGNSRSAKLSPEDMQAGRLAGGDLAKGDSKSWIDPTRRQTFHMMPWDLAKKFISPGQDKILTKDGQATPRQYLIQPPDEYRQPASTAALPKPKDVKDSEWVKEQLYKRQDNKNPALITPNQQQ